VTRALPGSVLVTGASGFLGGHVCAAFVGRGAAVRALVRQPGRVPAGTEPWVISGLEDTAGLRRALAGVTFEDFDLSLRFARQAAIAYVPAVRIRHAGGDAAGKGWAHRGMFIRSAFTFFQRHGWRLW